MLSHTLSLLLDCTTGIRGNVLLMDKKTFTSRTHQTIVDNSLSAIAELISFDVQGSGIGPLMFPLYTANH